MGRQPTRPSGRERRRPDAESRWPGALRTSRSGLDLMQVSGFTVVADKLNQAVYRAKW